MSARSFFDTNVLVYGDDAAAGAKQKRALALFEEHRRARSGVVSLQILQEYFMAATQKLRVDAVLARSKVELISKLDVVILDQRDVLAAIDFHRLHQFSFWDALVFQAAKQGGCRVIFSEDWQHSREVDGVRIINPFLA